MFAGGRRRSSNIRAMHLFHELKQQFPTVPDHIVTACIATHAYSNSPNKDTTIREILEAAAVLSQQQEPMGRTPPESKTPTLTLHTNPQSSGIIDKTTPATERNRFEMNDSFSDHNRNVKPSGVKFFKRLESIRLCPCEDRVAETASGRSSFFVKRPNHLDIKPDTCTFPDSGQNGINQLSVDEEASAHRHNIQLSEKCKDVHKLLNSVISDKPPRSPLNSKRLINAKSSPTRSEQSVRSPLASPDVQKRLPQFEEPKKKETASTPTQTTDTLLGGGLGGSGCNLSLNVNCSMDVVQSPTNKRTSVLQLTPQQPWLQEPISPRSYTSVNLTLRPPSSEPQAPIDITSQNSSLTYSTSSFDSQKGLQSRLQITVGPGGTGSVSSVRARPRSSYHPEASLEDVVPVRAGSLNNLLAANNNEPPVVLKQQARIERLRIELRTEKTKLLAMQTDVAELETKHQRTTEDKVDAEVEKQLRKEIKHLRFQCDHLSRESDKIDTCEDFYHNIYTGQRGPLNLDAPNRLRRQNNISRRLLADSTFLTLQDNDGPKWNCSLCTFLNHPDLDKCEQCELPRILHGKRPSNPNVQVSVQQPPYTNANASYHIVPSQSLPDFLQNLNNSNSSSGSNSSSTRGSVINRPIGFVLNNNNPLNYAAHNPPQQFQRHNL